MENLSSPLGYGYRYLAQNGTHELKLRALVGTALEFRVARTSRVPVVAASWLVVAHRHRFRGRYNGDCVICQCQHTGASISLVRCLRVQYCSSSRHLVRDFASADHGSAARVHHRKGIRMVVACDAPPRLRVPQAFRFEIGYIDCAR